MLTLSPLDHFQMFRFHFFPCRRTYQHASGPFQLHGVCELLTSLYYVPVFFNLLHLLM